MLQEESVFEFALAIRILIRCRGDTDLVERQGTRGGKGCLAEERASIHRGASRRLMGGCSRASAAEGVLDSV
jgi:hypothetical protein